MLKATLLILQILSTSSSGHTQTLKPYPEGRTFLIEAPLSEDSPCLEMPMLPRNLPDSHHIDAGDQVEYEGVFIPMLRAEWMARWMVYASAYPSTICKVTVEALVEAERDKAAAAAAVSDAQWAERVGEAQIAADDRVSWRQTLGLVGAALGGAVVGGVVTAVYMITK